MSEIIYIADTKILSIPIIECHEEFIDIKHQSELKYGPVPECQLTANCYTKIRKTVFEKLCQARKCLPKGWRFRLYEGFRSLEVQQMLFEQEYKRVTAQHPQKSHSELFYQTTRLISPVRLLDGSENIPAHNTGGAIDIEIISEEGQLVDMGMAIKDWSIVDPDLCLSDCGILDKTAQENRKLLREILIKHGFVNYPTEWWHFSYGDCYWAYHKAKDNAIYGSADKLS